MDENSKTVTLERVFDAPRELVWKAWTDPDMLAKWFGPRGFTNPESEVDARVGGKIRIVMLAGEELGPMAGQRAPMEGEFTELKEPEKLVFKNQAVDETGNVLIDGLTTVTFDDLGGKTKLTVTATAKGMVPEAKQMLEGMDAGWSQSLDKLGELLEQGGTA